MTNRLLDKPFGVPIDFPYNYDANGNPTLLIPKEQSFQTQEFYRVEFNQTATHLHHAKALGIKLPKNFDMAHYLKLDNADKIKYANQIVPKKTIIEYQNTIARKISQVFSPERKSIPGSAGKRHYPSQLIVTPAPAPTGLFYDLAIIREDGLHITTFHIDGEKLKKIAKDDFWVLQKQDL